MKKAILFLGVAAVAILAGCTKSEMKVNNETKTFEGDKAYVVVKISDVGTSGTKATSPGYEYGSDTEYAINDASFYFYGSDGAFVAEADASGLSGQAHENLTDDNGNFVDEDGETIIANAGEDYVEYDAYTVITLQGLATKAYPTWVVTVLNKPSDFTRPSTLEEFAEKLAGGIKVGNYYTMSTSSYVGDDNGYPEDSPAYWFATPVVADNFSLEELSDRTDSYPYYKDADGNDVVPINIYVERLAAKVTLDIDDSSSDLEKVGDNIYKISNEVADSKGVDTPTDLYVKINGWALNATAKNSNMVKDIDAAWSVENYFCPTITGYTYKGDPDDMTFWSDWNVPSDHRSFWGRSWNYGIGDYNSYPSSSEGNTDSTQDDLNTYLDYTSLNGNLKDLGEYLYCAENTNTAGNPDDAPVIYHMESSAITSILVSATLCSNSDGTPVEDMVLCDGVLYYTNDYLNYALDHLASHVVYYYEDGTTDGIVENPDYDPEDQDSEQYITGTVTKYSSIDKDYVKLVDDYDGNVHVALKSDYESTSFYTIETDDNGIVSVTGTYTADQVDADLNQYFNTNYGSDANAFVGGRMYYNIPIEHLNNDYAETYEDSDEEVQTLVLEANYGVVRNHIYKVTITGVADLGRGIYNPNEVIIPQPEVKTYALTAEIHILSWKIVEQNAHL